MSLAAETVADRLRSEATRTAALDALEALAPPIPGAVALNAAPALHDAMATETERASYDRCGLLLGQVLDEAAPNPAAVFGAATGGSRLAAFFAPALLVEAVQPLTRADAHSYACLWAHEVPAFVRGYTAPQAAAGRTVTEMFGIVRSSASAPRPSLSHAHPLSLCLWRRR